ncbi:MAG: hypothetical protein K6U74_10265, partial [Firmicutes bacterium]|nr:hypothetical protein [Bacillota bacterium]
KTSFLSKKGRSGKETLMEMIAEIKRRAFWNKFALPESKKNRLLLEKLALYIAGHADRDDKEEAGR